MKSQTTLIKNIKGHISSLLKLVALGVKKYIVKLIDLENQLEIALKQQLQQGKKTMKVQVKTGSEWHTTERRSAMVLVNGKPIYEVLKPTTQSWEEVGNKGKHGKWCIAEYILPVGAKIEFKATANGQDPIVFSFKVGEVAKVDVDGYNYGSDVCGWIVSI
jgi:hypothetical protein